MRNILVIFGITLMGVIGVSILSPAFPEIKTGLNISDFEVAMLITAFTLPGVFLAPVMGFFADRFGRKKTIVPCLFLFGLSGFLCSFADFKTMLLLRFFQGIGGAALTSLAVTLIGDIYDGIERVKILGYNTSVLSIGLAIYPAIGGLLAEINWRFPFLLFLSAIPIGLIAMTIEYRYCGTRIPVREYFVRSFKLFLRREVLIGFLSGCTVFIITYGTFMLYIPFLLEIKFNISPFSRGLVQSSTLLFTAIIASRLKFFIKKFGQGKTICFGFISYAASLLFILNSQNLLTFLIGVIVYGLGHGTVLPTLQNLIVSLAPMENRAIVMSSYSSMIRIGQTTGPMISSVLAFYSIGYVFLASTILAISLAILNYFNRD